MDKSIGAIITGGDFQGLAVLRTLAAKGIPVVLIDHEFCIGRTSRYKKKFFKAPNPANENEYIDFLINLVKMEKLFDWIIYPNSDQIVHVLSKNKNKLNEFINVPVPNYNVIDKVYNKKNTYQVAESLNIPIPKTYFSQDLDGLLNQNLEYPLVVKPAIRDHFYNKVKKKAYKVENQQQLIEVYNFVNSIIDSSEILVQEFLNGGPKNLYSFCPFYKKGEIKASITARRFRQHPMDFGHATTFAETVQIPELEYFAAKFLKEIDYYGICEVEFMYDHSENVYKLIEVNPRVWGWHSLAIAAGADLPYLLYLDLTGGKSLISEIKSNLKWVRLTTDSATVAKEILKGRLNLFDYIRSLSGKKSFAVFSWNDPLPFFTEIFLIPYLWKKRGF